MKQEPKAEIARRVTGVAALARREVDLARVAAKRLLTVAPDRLREISLDSSGKTRGLSSILESQGALVSHLCKGTRGQLEALRESTGKALSVIHEIEAVSRGIQEVARDAGILALNAQISAVHTGRDGAAADAIAARMRAVATEVASLSKTVGTLASETAREISELDRLSADGCTGADEWAATLEPALQACALSFATLCEGLAKASEQGRATERSAVGEAQAVLAALVSHDELLPTLGALVDAEPEEARECARAIVAASTEQIARTTAALGRVNDAARAHLGLLDGLRPQLDAEDAQGFRGRLSALEVELACFLSSHRDWSKLAGQSVGRARARAPELARTVDEMHRIALELSMLGVATRVEAARLGDRGTDFRAVGERIQELVAAVRGALRRNMGFSGELARALGSIAGAVHGLERSTLEFSETLEADLRDQERASESALRAVDDAFESTRLGACAIRDASFEAIRHLQFQDRMTQELESIERILDAGEDPDALALVPSHLGTTSDTESLASGDCVLF